MENPAITFAAKCAPDVNLLRSVQEAGLKAVELFTNSDWLKKLSAVVSTCNQFELVYAVHAPTDGFQPDALAALAEAISAQVVVFHDVYWDDEWETINHAFSGIETRLCVENVATVHEPVKFMRRFGMGRCLDLEHLQMEAGGVFEEVFLEIMKEASHIHMSGYTFGSELWHTHIHHSPEHSTYLLNLLRQTNYSGMVVSEARTLYQNDAEFVKLNSFLVQWLKNSNCS